MKKPEAEYAVKFVRKTVVDDFRGDRILGDLYCVTKFIPSTSQITEYEVTLSTIGDWCTCPGGRRYKCKHLGMVREKLGTD